LCRGAARDGPHRRVGDLAGRGSDVTRLAGVPDGAVADPEVPAVRTDRARRLLFAGGRASGLPRAVLRLTATTA